MSIARFTLVADGPRDRCLVPIIQWVMSQIEAVAAGGFTIVFADARSFSRPRLGLPERIRESVHRFPCDVVFVHRDSENQSPSLRRREIGAAIKGSGIERHVPVVPVRMTEAWLLSDERAIRTAANNPNGTSVLPLPRLDELEAIPDPKRVLNECLVAAQDLGLRRRRQFHRRLGQAVHRVAELTESFDRLRALPAFETFEKDVRAVVAPVI